MAVAPEDEDQDSAFLGMQSEAGRKAETARRGPCTILVVDDDTDFHLLIKFTFSGLHEVYGTQTVDEALSFLQRTPVDLVLLDINLPGRMGWDLLDALRQMASAPPVIVVTQDTRSVVRKQAEQLGAANTFFKPIVPTMLRRYGLAVLDINRNSH
ncbi:MAG: response regulator [Anaerolineae bacterium]|nr:response regulator [Anaerolineae bacterium]